MLVSGIDRSAIQFPKRKKIQERSRGVSERPSPDAFAKRSTISKQASAADTTAASDSAGIWWPDAGPGKGYRKGVSVQAPKGSFGQGMRATGLCFSFVTVYILYFFGEA